MQRDVGFAAANEAALCGYMAQRSGEQVDDVRDCVYAVLDDTRTYRRDAQVWAQVDSAGDC